MKRKILTVIILVLAGLLSLHLREPEEFKRQSSAMDTIISMTVYDDDKVLDDAFALLNELDNRLSMYNPSSDVSIINNTSGRQAVTVSRYTVETVSDSLRLHEITGGVFNPLIGTVTKLWKINKSGGSRPSPESLDMAVKLSDIRNLVVEGDSVFLREKGCVLDLGGIAKGYASTEIANLMKNRGVKSAIIDLGGNIHTVGSKPDGSEWHIGIRNPLNPFAAPALVVKVTDSAVITSGNYERFKTIDGKKFSHFFDPATGESVMSDLLSVTVISPDGSLADGLATAFMITGIDKALEILRNIDNPPGVVFITQDRITATSNLKGSVIPTKFATPVTFAEVP